MKKLFTLLILLCAVVTAQADWYVSGDFNNWGADEMTHAGNGIYKYSTTLKSDSQFKVRDSNSNWDHAYPDNNYYLSVSETKDVTIWFVESNHHIWVQVGNSYWYDNTTPSDVLPIWTVVGCLYENNTENNAPNFVGDKWSLWSTSNEMVETESGSGWWKKSYSLVPAGTYWFKVANNHGWNTAYPNNNYVLTVPNDNSTVDIYFDVANTAVKTYVHGVWSVAGSSAALNGSTDWEATTDNDMTNTDGTVWTLDVSEKYLVKGTTYEFKVINNHAWDFAYPSSNETFTVDVSGYYDITYSFDTSNNSVSVSTERITTYDKYIYVRKDTDTAPYCYVWDYNGTTDKSTDLNGNWPGTQISSTAKINGVTYWKAGPFVSGVDTSAGLGYIVSDSGNNQTENLWLGHKTDYLIYKSAEATQANRVIFIPRLWGIPDWDFGTLLVPNGESENEFILEGQEISAWYEFGILIGNQYYGCTSTSERLEVVSPAGYNLDLGAYGNENQVKNFVLRNSYKCDISVNTSTNKLSLVSKLELPYFTEYGGSVYDNETFTMKTSSNWSGISLNIIGATSGQVKGDFLVVKKKETNQELYVYVKYTDNNESQKHFTDPEITTCALPLDPTKNIKEVQLKNPVAGSITFTDLYVTSSKQSVTLNSDGTNGWATFAAASPVSFANQDNVQVNIITKEGNVLRKAEVASKEVPAGSAVLLYYEGLTSGTSVNVPVLNAAPAALDGSNVLLSSGEEGLDVTEAKRYYILGNGTSGVGFYPVQTSTTIAAYKGYIDFGTSGLAPQFLWFDGETTAIDALNNESETLNDGPVYDLSGRKVNGQLHRGIYVQNGKKFIVK